MWGSVYIIKGDREDGPYTHRKLYQMRAEGKISDRSPVRVRGSRDWVPLHEIIGPADAQTVQARFLTQRRRSYRSTGGPPREELSLSRLGFWLAFFAVNIGGFVMVRIGHIDVLSFLVLARVLLLFPASLRMVDLGKSSWEAIWIVPPVIGSYRMIQCLAFPGGYNSLRQLDGTGRTLLPVLTLLLLLEIGYVLAKYKFGLHSGPLPFLPSI